MDDLQFRKQLLVDPFTQDSEFIDWCNTNPTAKLDLKAAQAFDKTLKKALELPVPEGLIDDILMQQNGAEVARKMRQKHVGYFAIAASFVLSIGFGMQLWLSQPDLSTFAIQHYHHEPEAVLSTAEVSESDVDWLFSEYGLKVTKSLGKVTYLKRCPMFNKTGIHMVIQTAQGAVTVFYMPDKKLNGNSQIKDVGLHGELIAASKGVFAFLGRPGQSFIGVEHRISQSIRSI
ncbi:MAG: DUF3379 family protein [bacterium]